MVHVLMRPPPGRRTRNGGPTMMVGDRVRLCTPDNERLHGTEARVAAVMPWGAHVSAPAAASGQYRASWEEMELLVEYVGESCQFCGGMRLRRTGSCKVCEDCGESGGCV